MSWPANREEGYKKVPDVDITGGDIWTSGGGMTPAACKAVCNSNSRCKSFVFRKSDGVCFLNSLTESAPTTTATGHDTYYKQGEPANDKRVYLTKSRGPESGWRNNGLYDRSGICFRSRDDCEDGNFKVGNTSEYAGPGDRCLGIPDWSRLKDVACTRVPNAANMCPNIGQTPDDLVYFRHTQAASGKVEDYDYGQRYDDNWTNDGSNLSSIDGSPVTCGYNRVDKSKWPQLDTWFDATTKANIIRDQCTGPSVFSRDLAADSIACGAMMDNSEYNQAILNKLKTEPYWWTNPINCTNFENVVTAKTNDQAVMRVAGELIDSLPDSGWSNGLVTALNSMKGNGNIPLSLKSKIDPKITAYCAASDENNNEKCACRNAAVRGKAKTCQSDIVGCADVKRYTDLIEKAKNVNQTFGTQMETIYDPNSQSDACQNTKLPTSTILRFGNVGDSKLDVAACFTEFENSGKIGGDVSLKCDIAVKNYESAQTASGGGTSSSSSSGDGEDGTIISGKTAGIKNDYWIVIACFICVCFMIIGVGLAAFLL